MRRILLLLPLALAALTLAAGGAPEAPATDAAALAGRIDGALEAAWREQGLQPTAGVDDATFLRRLSLDLCGTIPTRQEVETFRKDRSRDKRAAKIEEYLSQRASADHLAALWTDLLLSGADREREREHLEPWLADALHQGRAFADIVRELVAGRGRTDENGAGGFVISYQQDPEGLSSVTARTFLGLQIQCARCHDHPYDRWTQQDFRGFTSFFGGVRASRVSEMDLRPRVYRVYDVAPRDRDREGRKRLLALIRRARRQAGELGTAALAGAAVMAGMADDVMLAADLEEVLTDEDASEEQVEAALASLPADLQERLRRYRERQAAYGEPRYLGGDAFRDTDLLTPREALAEWIVDPDNEYFGRAVANRLWRHLYGQGLTEPVDDLSGHGDVVLPQLLDELGRVFVESGTDLRLLLRAMTLTDAYARAPDAGGGPQRDARERWFAAHPVRPLSPEQVLHSLVRATATEEYVQRRDRGKVLERFKYIFSDDEGGESDRFEAGIPQALFLLNSRFTNEAIAVRRSDLLKEILDEEQSAGDRVEQMFLATLSRPPTAGEKTRLVRLARDSKKGRGRGMEDLYFALLNSSEFLTNH